MKLGVSQIDITPQPGVELSGFAARIQPSIGILDPLFAKAIYISQDKQYLLWIHTDLIGLEREFVNNFRDWCFEEFGFLRDRVMISSTHTHSAPAVIHLNEAGTYDPQYLCFLEGKLRQAAKKALGNPLECELVTGEGLCRLCKDRRSKASAHTDYKAGAVGFRQKNGNFVCAIINYPMHAVALGASNRKISADVPGKVATFLSEHLPGSPVVLATNGACGNLNPPEEGVSVDQIIKWGGEIAGSVLDPLLENAPSVNPEFSVRSERVLLPVETLDEKQIESNVSRALRKGGPVEEWGAVFERAVKSWREEMIRSVREGNAEKAREAEIFAVRLGNINFLGINAEVFSKFTELVRSQTGLPAYVVGYANGVMGYLPTIEAFQEGGYEADAAHYFYNAFALKSGGLEHLANQASKLLLAFVSVGGQTR